MSNTVDILIRTQAQMQGLQSLVQTWLPRLITLGTAYKAIGLVKDQIDFADAMGKSAQKAGVLVEQFSALAHGAEQSDIASQELVLAFKHLNDWMEKTGRSTENNVGVLLETAELFERMPDGVQKTNLAVERFGRAGINMIPFLNQGRDGITELMEEAEKLNRVVSLQTAQAAERFNDNLTKLKASTQGLSYVLGATLLPVLNDLLEDLRELASAGVSGDGKGGLLGEVGLSLQVGYRILKEAAKEFGSLVQGGGADFAGAWRRAVFGTLGDAHATSQTGDQTKIIDPVAGVDAATNRALHLRAIRSAQVGAQGEGLSDQVQNEIANLKQTQEALGAQFTEMFVPDTNDTEYTAAFAKVADDWYKLADEIVQAEQWMADEKRRIRERDLENTRDGLANLKEVARAFGKEGFVAYQALAIAEAIVATYLAATKALADGDSYSAVFRAAAITAAGIANVATIAGTSYGGARERGGPVDRNRVYLTGERGPELFMPREAGTIVPADLTNRMLSANLSPSFSPTVNVGASAPPAVYLLNNRQDMIRAARTDPEFARAVVGVFKDNRLDFGSPT